MWCFPIELFGGPNWGPPSRYFDLKYSPPKNYMAKITTYPSPVTQGPQIGPQLCIRKGAQRYFFFKNVFDHVFSTMPGFKSLKNTFFAIFDHYCVIHSLLGPPNRPPITWKFYHSKIQIFLNFWTTQYAFPTSETWKYRPKVRKVIRFRTMIKLLQNISNDFLLS